MGFYFDEFNKEDIAIIMEDNCTRGDAIRHLKNGTIVYDADEWLEAIVRDYGYYDGSEDQEICADCNTIEELRKKVYTEHYIDDSSALTYKGKRYLISYVY